MTRTVLGFSVFVVLIVFVAGLAAHILRPPVEPRPHTTPVKPMPVLPDKKVESKYAFHYFGASWCEACRRMQDGTLCDNAVKTALDNKFGFNIAIYNIDNVPALAAALHIDLVPTFLIYEGEKPIKRHSGYLSPADFLEWIK
jgi:thiol-disulfide isomerase/thioredoxin